jgi:hypothetical protein
MKKVMAYALAVMLVLSSVVIPARLTSIQTHAETVATGAGNLQAEYQLTKTQEGNQYNADQYKLTFAIKNASKKSQVEKYKITIEFSKPINDFGNLFRAEQTKGISWYDASGNSTWSDAVKCVIDITEIYNNWNSTYLLAPGESYQFANGATFRSAHDGTDVAISSVTAEITSSSKVEVSADNLTWDTLGLQAPKLDSDAEPGDAQEDVNYYVSWAVVKFGSYFVNKDEDKEDILWRVLKVDGNNVTLLSDKVLVPKAYGDGSVTWETSVAREYLNNQFVADAFTAEQQAALVETQTDNSSAGEKSNGGNNTYDKVVLPSYSDMTNTTYGFYGSDSRVAAATDYVKKYTKSGRIYNASIKVKNGNVGYYTRTPGYYQYDVMSVSNVGQLSDKGWRVSSKTGGYRPMIVVDTSKYKLEVSESDQVNVVTKGDTQTATAQSYAKVGSTKKIGDVTYTVTKASAKAQTVAVTSVAKSAEKVVIPSEVTIKDVDYEVTAIKANSFKKAKHLKKIQIKSKNITSINKNAFAGLDSSTTVKIVKGKYKAYKKLIKNKKVKVQKIS